MAADNFESLFTTSRCCVYYLTEAYAELETKHSP
jgi:hypothetical protein